VYQGPFSGIKQPGREADHSLLTSKLYKLAIIHGDEIHVYLGYNTVAIKQNFVDTAELTEELTGNNTFVIGSKH
jgi:hypothetical protein